MALTFCFDRFTPRGIPYPNLARIEAEIDTPKWQTFDHHWPRTVPLRLLYYFTQHGIAHVVVPTAQVSGLAWYPVCFGWFDFACDYVGMIPHETKDLVRSGRIKILFYYHEGDNPYRIKKRLDQQCENHGIGPDRYLFVSANSAADGISGCCYFQDHESFFRYRNRFQHANPANRNPSYDFLILNRSHKWWRATCMADLQRHGLLENSLWSYNTALPTNENFDDNPIEIDSFPDMRSDLLAFVESGPYYVDGADDVVHNDHSRVNTELYFRSKLSIILETHFDADQSGGTFLTEKTFKAIKYGHPFVIAGPAGSLDRLRKDGYRVFDGAIDNSYDAISDNTQRWDAIRRTIKNIQQQRVDLVAESCQSDVDFNRDLFGARGATQLNILIKRLLNEDR